MPPPPVPCRRCRCPECSRAANDQAVRLIVAVSAAVAGLSLACAALLLLAIRTGWLRDQLWQILLSRPY